MKLTTDIRSMQRAHNLDTSSRKERDLAHLKKACQEFESIYVNQMMKEARKTIPDGGLLPKSNATEIFEGMLDMEQSRAISQKSAFGIGKAMYQQMAGHIEKRKS